MADLFNTWSRLVTAGMSMQQTGRRAVATLNAANAVIAARTPIINSAVLSPLTGDQQELKRMIPEKVEAFSQSASATASGLWNMQATMLAHMQHLGAMAVRGRPPTLSEVIELNTRHTAMAVELTETMARTGVRALAPVHSAATANARRLGKKR